MSTLEYRDGMRLTTILLTIPVVALLTQPLWAPQWGAGILGEVAAFGPVGAVLALVAFFGLVALYCASLQRLLAIVPAEHRARSPRSVWLMFAIPFNFIEDLVIVADIATSLRRQAVLPDASRRRWLVLGMTWAGLQIASLLPGEVGVVAGVLALVVWVVHWALTAAIRRRLAAA